MQIAQDTRTAPQLTAQARAAAAIFLADYRFERFLPSQDNYSLSYDFKTNDVALADAASFRSWNTTTDYGRTEGSQSRSGKLPPIGRKYRVDEKEQLTLYGQNDALGAKFEEYARRGGIAIAARVVLAQAEAVEFATLTLEENGLSLGVDYGRKASHSVTAARAWTAADSDPLADFEAWDAVYRATNGVNPASRLLSTRALTALSKNVSIIALAFPTATVRPSRISFADVFSVLASFGITGIEVYDEAIDGTRLLSENAVLYVPENGSAILDGGPLGTTEWGIPAEAIRPAYGIGASERPGIFAGAFDYTDPEGTNVNSSAVVIPAVRNADATFRAEVLAP